MEDLLKSVEAPVNPAIPELFTGDTVSVHVKIKEGNRERIQEFKGVVVNALASNRSSINQRASASNSGAAIFGCTFFAIP